MKVITKLLMLLILLAVCMPAQGHQVIVFKVRQINTYVYESDPNWSSYNYRSRGYLIVDALFDSYGAVDGIDSLTWMEFGRSTGGDKWFSESNPAWDFRRVADANDVNDAQWAFMNGDTDPNGGALTVLHGQTRNINTGGTVLNSSEVPQSLSGWTLTSDPGMMSNYFGTENWQVRLDGRQTRNSNQEGLNFNQVRNNIRARLRHRGYPAEDPS